MRLNLTVRRGHVNDGVRSYVEAKFVEARPPPSRRDARRGRARPRAQPEDRRRPRGRGRGAREGAEPPRPRGGNHLRGGDRPPRRQARAPDRAPSRQEGAGAAAPRSPGRPSPLRSRRSSRRSGSATLSHVLPLPHDPGPHWGEVGIHGLHRQREWDAVVTVEAPSVTGDERVVRRARGRPDRRRGRRGRRRGDRVPRSRRRRRTARRAVRRDGRVWAVAVRRIETVELSDDPGGDFVELAWDGVERTVRIDGEPTLGASPSSSGLGAGGGGLALGSLRPPAPPPPSPPRPPPPPHLAGLVLVGQDHLAPSARGRRPSVGKRRQHAGLRRGPIPGVGSRTGLPSAVRKSRAPVSAT